MIAFNLSDWSLTRRLSVFFALAMGVIVLILTAILFLGLVNQLKKKNEQELKNILLVQEGVIQTIHNERRPSLWQQRWFENFDPDARLMLRIIAPDGTLYAESKDLSIPLDAFPPPSEAFDYKIWKGTSKNGQVSKVYLTAKTVKVRNGRGVQTWLIQTALNVSQEHILLNDYLKTLPIVILAALILTSLTGWPIVRRGLKPLRELNHEIQLIGADRLNTRIGNKPWPNELKALAASFDNMLGRLERSFNELARFSSDIAHEFRAPINNILAAASVTQLHTRTEKEYEATLVTIIEESERLSRMISTMLFLARADNARQAVQREQLDTAEIFSQLIEFFDSLAEEKQISFITSGENTLYADGQLIRRALSNLIDNALRYTPPGGTITLTSAAQPEGIIMISVADSGEGIDPQYLPHIFERFFRVDSARSSGENTGLGLAIVKSIMEIHGGAASVQSVTGRGSTFTLTFPSA